MRDATGWDAEALRRLLLGWYAEHQRDLPWRRTADPYAIWVSEIMLQQTRVAAVIERYNAFIARFPTVASLAEAAEQDVLALWSGLGYYRRARMLHNGAKRVVAEHNGRLPGTAEALRTLPGIGAYTAAAVASIAYGEPVAVVDGNVERVLLRLAGWAAESFGGETAQRRAIENLAAQLVDPRHAGDYNQAMMELGATVCLPRNPQCLVCPLAAMCRTRGEHVARKRPRMTVKRAAYALCVRNATAKAVPEVLLEQRGAHHTVMPGLWELPALRDIEVPEADLRMTVRHAIMNVNYVVQVRDVAARDAARMTERAGRRLWVRADEAATMALTGLARKVLTRARILPQAEAGRR